MGYFVGKGSQQFYVENEKEEREKFGGTSVHIIPDMEGIKEEDGKPLRQRLAMYGVSTLKKMYPQIEEIHKYRMQKHQIIQSILKYEEEHGNTP